MKYLNTKHKIIFSNIFLDACYENIPDEIDESLFHKINGYAKKNTREFFDFAWDGPVRIRENSFYSKILPEAIVNNCTYYYIFPCKIVNKNENALLLFESNHCKYYVCPFVSVEKLIKDNFSEVDNLSGKRFVELMQIMNNKVLDGAVYLDKKFSRLFSFYKNLETINKNSFLNQLHYYKLPLRMGYLLDDEFAYYFIPPYDNDIFNIDFTTVINDDFSSCQDIIQFEKNISNEMK